MLIQRGAAVQAPRFRPDKSRRQGMNAWRTGPRELGNGAETSLLLTSSHFTSCAVSPAFPVTSSGSHPCTGAGWYAATFTEPSRHTKHVFLRMQAAVVSRMLVQRHDSLKLDLYHGGVINASTWSRTTCTFLELLTAKPPRKSFHGILTCGFGSFCEGPLE